MILTLGSSRCSANHWVLTTLSDTTADAEAAPAAKSSATNNVLTLPTRLISHPPRKGLPTIFTYQTGLVKYSLWQPDAKFSLTWKRGGCKFVHKTIFRNNRIGRAHREWRRDWPDEARQPPRSLAKRCLASPGSKAEFGLSSGSAAERERKPSKRKPQRMANGGGTVPNPAGKPER